MVIVPERRWLSATVVSFQLLDVFKLHLLCAAFYLFFAAGEGKKELPLSGIFVGLL